MVSNVLAHFNAAGRELAKITSVDEAKEVRDKAEAVRLYLKKARGSLTLQNQAAEIKIRAERRMGELLAKTVQRGRAPKTSHHGRFLPEGINFNQSSRYQAIASIPTENLERHLAETIAKAEEDDKTELTSTGVLRLAKAYRKQRKRSRATIQDGCTVDDLQTLIDAGRKYGTIYADPPWPYGNQSTRAATSNHYDTLGVDEIAALPIADLAADSAHLHLWTTNAFLFDGLRIIEEWSFEYKSCFVWVKPQMGIGNYWRVSHEFMLLGVRGGLRFADKSQRSWLELKRERHSKKPEEIRQIIELVSLGPCLELFGRHAIDGWDVWGNQISRDLLTQGIVAQ